ncbi:hypothetical protein CUT44_01905 [Streptomyces carminius]|uniref:DUF4232 domain-containing protein n=1 Tax=Streptomyces carminius TaxID=2665496 RepID=A0A2M8M1E0_9ACTN|nr:DUF4232 domain-containing protein [Streptomyces carminius]PJE98020.1 hypothetical protein CUT44_10165 [Streptomyces carminius]PJF01846.1 hypothetical protein CUT44_01905 [Streptomyces carminius]
MNTTTAASGARRPALRPALLLPVIGLLAACGTQPAPSASSPHPSAFPRPDRLASSFPEGHVQYGLSPSPRPSPSASSCPASGLRVQAEEAEAAMGLRVLGVRLVNCGETSRTIRGRPGVRVLDGDGEPLEVEILHKVSEIALIGGLDDAPAPVPLDPGESAVARLVWRNTVTDPTVPAATGSAVEIDPLGDREPRTVPAHLDLGNTGRLAVSPWAPVPR